MSDDMSLTLIQRDTPLESRQEKSSRRAIGRLVAGLKFVEAKQHSYPC